MRMLAITSSIVAFKNNPDTLRRAIESFIKTDLAIKLYVIDNSPSDEIRKVCKDGRVEYIFNNRNLGFGAGHNIAIRRSVDESAYHLVLNPDVFFSQGTLESLYDFMEDNKDIGLVMPNVRYSDGSTQYLCKLLPTPLDFVIRSAFLKNIESLSGDKYYNYELRFSGYDEIMDVPSLSGCFMFIRNEVFGRVGMFDERFFIHFEDIDLTRRIFKHYRTVYYPGAVVYHEKDPARSLKMLSCLTASYIKYFNKWGWFFDKERDGINKKTLEKLKVLR